MCREYVEVRKGKGREVRRRKKGPQAGATDQSRVRFSHHKKGGFCAWKEERGGAASSQAHSSLTHKKIKSKHTLANGAPDGQQQD